MSRLAGEEGETAVASTILVPLLLFGLFMLIQILLGFYVRSVASAAATDAASFLAQDGVTAGQAEAYATNFINDQSGGLVSNLSVTASKSAEFTNVSVNGDTNLLWSVGLGVDASAPVERFEPQGP